MDRQPNVHKTVFHPRRRKPTKKIQRFTKEEIERYRQLFEKKFENNGKKHRKKKGNPEKYMDWDDKKIINAAHSKAKDGISLMILDHRLYLELWRRELYEFAYPTKREKA